MNTPSYKWSQNAPYLHPFFEKFLEEVPGPQPSCDRVFPHALTPPHHLDWSTTPSGSVPTCSFWIRHWQCNVYFNAILLKIKSISLSEFNRLYLHPDCTILHHFFKIFSGRPPEPPPTGGTPLPYPPHSALRASSKLPQAEFWIRHWIIIMFDTHSAGYWQIIFHSNLPVSYAQQYLWTWSRFMVYITCDGALRPSVSTRTRGSDYGHGWGLSNIIVRFSERRV